MAIYAILFGVLLATVGLVGNFKPELLGEAPDTYSPTALIPTWFGLALILCGILSLTGVMANKHAMHIAAVVGLLGAIGGFMPLFRSNFNFAKASAVSGVLLTGLSLIFLLLCIRSFIEARKAREASKA